MIKLVEDTISHQDINALIKWLAEYPRLTMGPLTAKLEKKWANWLGTEYSIFCNSGSSANLLMLQALLEANLISKDATVVVPAVAWATDLAPVMQLGLTPILCDINFDNLSVDLDHLRDLFRSEKIEVLMLVSALGLSPKMDRIAELCEKYNVLLLEDVCESVGSTYDNQKLGTFGLMSSVSTYFGHHFSTIEGGFVSTNSKMLYNILQSIRSHGWDRNMQFAEKYKLRDKWKVSDFDSLYTFYYSGFNMRSTDLQAFIGLRQIDRLDEVCKKRNENFKLYQKLIKQEECYKLKPLENTFVSNFAYPVISSNRDKIVLKLKKNNVECRPLICGSLGYQPFYTKVYGTSILHVADEISRYGFYVPNHPDLTVKEIEFICEIINKNM